MQSVVLLMTVGFSYRAWRIWNQKCRTWCRQYKGCVYWLSSCLTTCIHIYLLVQVVKISASLHWNMNTEALVSANVHLMIYELVLSEPSILTLLTILHRPYWKGGFKSECGLKHQESYNLLIRIFILHNVIV